MLDRSDGKRSDRQWSGGVVDKRRGDKLDRGERCSYSLVQSRMVEVGVDGRAVVGEVEEVSWSMRHVVVGEGLGGGKCGGRVVDNVLVRGVGGKDLGTVFLLNPRTIIAMHCLVISLTSLHGLNLGLIFWRLKCCDFG